MPLKKAPLIILALLAFFMASTAVVVKVKGQVGWSTTEIYNKVFDAANNRLMTTPWAGAQAGQYLSDTEILNKVFDSANNLLRTSGGGGGAGSSAFNDLTSGTNTTATMTVGSGATITPTGTGVIRATTLTDGDKGDVTSTAGVITIDNQVITYNKLQNETASTLLGRGSSGTGTPQELTLGTNLSISGTTLNATGGGSALILDLGNNGSNESTALSKLATTGDTNNIFTEPLPDVFLIDVSKKWPVAVLADTATVATSATSATSATTATNITDADKGDISITGGVWNVDPNTITYAKMQDVSAASRLLGRGSAAGGGDPQEITLGANCTMTGTVLNCTGGTGGVGVSGTPVVDQLAVWVDANTIKGSSSISVNVTDLDAGSATRTRPNLVSPTAPATCAVGDTYFDSDAPTGQNIYGCTAVNTWTLQGDGGGAGGGDASTNTSTSVDSEVVLFNGTTGKSLKRATGTGLAKLTAGVQSTVAAPTGAVVGTTDNQTLTTKTISGANNTLSNIAEGSLTLTDITTNNASITNHGFLKKLSNVATEFMNGQGNWVAPSGSSPAPTIITLSAATGTPTAVAVGTTGADIIAERFDISGTLTLIAPTGTPANGQSLLFRLKPASTPQTLSFTNAAGAFCAAAGLVLPTVTGDSSTYVEYGFHYNSGVTSPGACWVYDGGTKATAPLDVPSGGLGISSGTSGGIPAFTAAGTITSSGVLTANQPVIGGGAGAVPTVGSRSGNTTSFATTTGTLTNATCAQWDASGNLVSSGGVCGAPTSTVRSIGIDAGSIDVVGGCTLNASAVLVTNGPKVPTITCTDTNTDGIEFAWKMPNNWNAGTIQIELDAFSIGNNTTEVFSMNFSGQCVRSGDSPTAHTITTGATATSGSNVAATITWGNTANREQFITTSALTLGGTCAAGSRIYAHGWVAATPTTMTPMTDLKIIGLRAIYTVTGSDS